MNLSLRLLIAVSFAAAVQLAPGVRPARACEPPYTPLPPPCISFKVNTPGLSFPQNLADDISVAKWSFTGYAYQALDTFELSAPLTVARKEGDSYVEVAFELLAGSDPPAGWRKLRLTDPVPGDYIVASVDDTCSATPSPIGQGVQIGSFTLTETAAVPTKLGTAAWAGQELAAEAEHLGVDGECRAHIANVEIARNTIRVTLADEVLPWTEVLETSIEVDGKPFAGFGSARDSIKGRELTATIEHICSADDQDYLDSHPNKLTEGTHTVKLIGKIRELATFASTEAEFEIDCGSSLGCSAATGGRRAGDGPAWWALGAALLLFRARRARP